jgi:Tfp pilus assembly protein PilF
VRIAATLIECERQTTLWSDRYDRELTDIFALQDEIAAAVATALKTMFVHSGKAPVDPAAYDLFLRAQAQGGGSLEAGLEQIRLLDEVVALAPTFARGWATLAAMSAYFLRLYGAEAERRGVTRKRVVEAAETALRLDSAMGLAYQALAALEPFGRYGARETLVDKALGVAPNDPDVLARAAGFALTVGRVREGLDYARRAYELDPLQPSVANNYAILLAMEGRRTESAQMWESAVARWPDHAILIGNLVADAARRSDWRRVDALIEAADATLASTEILQRGGRFARNLRRPDPRDLRLWLEEQRTVLGATGTLSLLQLRLLSELGLTEEAFGLAEQASYAHMFDPSGPPPAGGAAAGGIFGAYNRAMIGDPRFVRLCAKLGLCDYWIETGKWPDCADEVPYDFRAEARRLAGARAS